MIAINWRYLFCGWLKPSTCLAGALAVCLLANIFIAAGSFWFGTKLGKQSEAVARHSANPENLERYLQDNASHPEKIRELISHYEKITFTSELMQADLAKAFTALGVANTGLSLLLLICFIMTLQKKIAPIERLRDDMPQKP
ncbi:hypothetical protein BH09VER1_BH09VER1_40600 [soil metagenome]